MALDFVPGGLATTQSLAAPGTVSGTIDAVDAYTGWADEDWYQIPLTAGSTYRFDMASSTLDSVLKLYNSSGTLTAYADAFGMGSAESLDFTPLASGSYYVSASDYWGGSGDFTLSAAVTATGGGTTGGSTTDSIPGGPGTTASLDTPGSVSGTIDTVDVHTGGTDEDWYQVSLTAGTTYRFDMTSATLDGVLRIYDSTGIQWAYTDSGLTGDPESLNFSPTSGGPYYVSISGWGGYTTGDFSLSAAVTATGGTVDTVGDWYTDANLGTLAATGSVSGNIDNGYDSDWYAVQLSAGQNYLFSLASSAPLDTALSLYDANGWYLDGSWTYQGDESLFFSASSTGTYYLAVYGDYANTGSFTLSSSVPAAGGTGIDTIQDWITTSATLAVGGSVDGTINSSTDHGDWYGVSLPGNTTYQFNLSAALLDGQLGLYDANGMSLSWADSGWTGDPEALVYTTGQAGTYYVGVSSYGGGAGDYQLGLSQLSTGSTVDNVGGNSGEAGFINVPGQVSGAIDNDTDTDWYGVTLDANTLYQFDLSSFFIDGILALYDSGGVQQAYMDNGMHAGDPESLYYTPAAAGTYYIGVSGYGGTTGSFQLDAIIHASQTGDFVVGDSSTTEAVSMPGTVWGVIDDSTSGDDADWYSVRLNAGTTYRVDLSGDSSLDGVLALYGADGANWLTGADAGYQGGSEYFYYSPTATGDYYLAVDGWGSTSGEFWLSVAQTSGSSATTDTVGQTIGDSSSVTVSSTAPGHVNGAIDSNGDADWYAVTLAANTQYEFNLGSLSLDGVLQLYDSSGAQLDYVDSAWSAGSENLVYATPAAGGTYYIGVSGYSGSTGDFLLDIYSSGTISNADTVGDTYQAAAAGLLNIGGSAVRGLVDSGVDEDVYSVALTAGTTYLFDLSSTSLDGTLTLYGAAGEWLDSADYGGTGGTENLYFTPLASGDYYIGVGGWSSSTGSYDLGASALAAAGGEVPGDNTSTENLPVPGFVDNQIGTSTDKDWFGIRMNQGSEYNFDLYSNDGLLDGILQVFDANGNPVYDQFGNGYADNGWYTGDAESLHFTAPTTGDYFIGVSGYGGTTGSYSLYAAEAWDATAIDWTATTAYDDIKWEVLDWWSWDTTAWSATSDAIAWSDVGWNEIADYSALEWSYVDWTEFDSTVYSELDYEQIEWTELLVDDWFSIDWNYIYADSLNWNQLQYEYTYDPAANYDPLTGWNIDLTAPDLAGNSNITGGAADDSALLGIGLDYFSGGLGDDSADGGEGADNLVGGEGNDFLNGGAGHDAMEGGAGNDTYCVDSLSDSIVEAGSVSGSSTLGFRLALDLSGNIDKVIASISYTLGNSLENLDLAAGSGNLTGAGNALNNVLTGNEGSNTLTGGAGNDSLDGGAGIDIAGYSGNRSGFTLAPSGAGFIVTDSTGAEGADTLANIERLAFAGSRIALDVTGGNAGTAAKILGAVFGAPSVSNQTYMGLGLGYLDGGISYTDLMAAALNAAGATTSNAVVSLLWSNLLGAAPTAAEAAPFVALLDSGVYSAGALGVLAADTDLNAANINLVGLAQMGIEYS